MAAEAEAAEAAADSASSDTSPAVIWRRRQAGCHPSHVISDDDVTLIIPALFDIRTDLRRVIEMLRGEDESQGSEEEDS